MNALFFGGLLPVVAFTIIEEKYGTLAGIFAGMIFGAGEIIFELIKYKKVETLTYFGNGLLIVMGVVSIFLNDGIWFKLQPALFEFIFTILFWFSLIKGKSILIWMAEKQKQSLPPLILPFVKGLTFRMGLFFLINALLTAWAAYNWSSTSWALLKGIGFGISFVIYMIAEVFYIRKKAQ